MTSVVKTCKEPTIKHMLKAKKVIHKIVIILSVKVKGGASPTHRERSKKRFCPFPKKTFKI